MRRREFLKTVGLSAAAAAVPSCISAPRRSPPRSAARKPNFVLVLVDDLGYKDAGFMGSRFCATPEIDRLASRGVVFTNAYANAPNCAPSRACLLSGQYAPRHGVYTVGTPERGPAHLRKLIPTPNRTTLAADVVTIAEALRPVGYVRASVGKWHLGRDPEFGPLAQGFDVNIGGGRAGHPRSYFSPYDNQNLADGTAGEYLTDRLTDEALNFIESNKDRPFFLYLPHFAVHTPLQAKRELIEKYKQKGVVDGRGNARYAAMIESVDNGVGRLMAKLDELDLADDTLVIFFSDNGGHGKVTSMAPLRGSKGMLYEGGIRVPLVMAGCGVARPDVSETPVIGTDLYPTILEMAGAAPPINHPLDGKSLRPLLDGGSDLGRDALFWHFPAYLEGYGKTKGAWRTTPAGAVRRGDWKLIEFFEGHRLELYNLKDDIGERNNLAGAMPDRARQLHDVMQRWRASVKAPVPTKRNPRYNPSREAGHAE